MNLNKILSMSTLIFVISINAQAESFKFVSAKMAKSDPMFPPATIKRYQALKPVTVHYMYGDDVINDEKTLFITYSKKETLFTDLTTWSSRVGNIKDPIVKNNIIKLIPKKINENCSYEGTAVVIVKNIEILIPEVAAEINFYSDITKVIKITKPKVIC